MLCLRASLSGEYCQDIRWLPRVRHGGLIGPWRLEAAAHNRPSKWAAPKCWVTTSGCWAGAGLSGWGVQLPKPSQAVFLFLSFLFMLHFLGSQGINPLRGPASLPYGDNSPWYGLCGGRACIIPHLAKNKSRSGGQGWGMSLDPNPALLGGPDWWAGFLNASASGLLVTGAGQSL